MLGNKSALWGALVAVLVVGAACSSAPAPQSPPATEPPQAEEAQPAQEEAGEPQPEQGAEEPEPAQEAVAGRPAAPAAIDADFRPDPASVVTATGNPQLVEFFAFW